MIPIRRPDTIPEDLTRRKKYRKLNNEMLSETDAITRTFDEAQAAGDPFEFKFERYGQASVRTALETMFHGKCAYCEQRYAGIQPMDVEHFRPKGMAQFGDGRVADDGYYWLAASWENLLPSCIDCNRGRTLRDIHSTKPVVMGKANQFPLVAGTDPVQHHSGDVATEQALLLNPCDPDFDPANHFVFLRSSGVIAPVTVTDENGNNIPEPRAEVSIRVFALNRSGLVEDRLGYIQIFEHRLTALEHLARFLADTRDNVDNDLAQSRMLAETMHHEQIEALFNMALDERPFAGMIRYLLRSEVPQLRAPEPRPTEPMTPIPPPVP